MIENIGDYVVNLMFMFGVAVVGWYAIKGIRAGNDKPKRRN